MYTDIYAPPTTQTLYSFSDTLPLGIVVDPTIRKLFFAEPIENYIASLNYDGSGFEIAVNTSRDLDQPFDLALDPTTRLSDSCSN